MNNCPHFAPGGSGTTELWFKEQQRGVCPYCERDALRAELAEANRMRVLNRNVADDALAARDEAIRGLREALDNYGQHKRECKWFMQTSSGAVCDCGLDAALAGATVQPPEGRPDEIPITRKTEWSCAAAPFYRADPPQDCGWPECGCDPNVERVILGLLEAGYTVEPWSPTSSAPAAQPPAGRGDMTLRESMALEALSGNRCWLGSSILRGKPERVAVFQPGPYKAPVAIDVAHAEDPWEALKLGLEYLKRMEGLIAETDAFFGATSPASEGLK